MIWNRIFALLVILIAGFAGGIVLSISWRVFAIALIALLCLLLGLGFWRASYEGTDFGTDRGFLRTRVHPAILFPIIFLCAGLAIAGALYGVIVK